MQVPDASLTPGALQLACLKNLEIEVIYVLFDGNS
jgi:hypothetical protein